jgi:hypothetical protein
VSYTEQVSFAAGEITPSLYARTDLAKYAIALRTCRNFIILRQGGVSYRPGLMFANEVKTSAAGKVRLLPFVFNITDTLVMEFGNRYVRFTQNGAPVMNGMVPAEAVTPYVTSELQQINYVQSGDVVWLVHPNHPPAHLTRVSNTNWVYSVITFAPLIAAPTGLAVLGTLLLTGHSYLYGVTAVSDATGEESFVTQQPSFHAWADPSETTPHTVTWNAVAGCSTYNVYLAMDKGALGYIAVANVANLTYTNTGLQTIDPTTQPPIPFTDFTGAGNYPSVVNCYQQRVAYAGTNNNPAKVWLSRSGNYNNFNQSTPIQDDSPIVFTIISDEIDAIEHLVVMGKMVIGTQGAEWLADGDPNGVLTPSSVNDRIGSYNGCSPLRPVKADNTILYVQSEGNAVLALKTNVLYGYYTFQNEDLTLLSAHLFKGVTIVDWAYQKTPNYTVWAVRSDGILLSLTYLPDQQLIAWARHDTVGLVESVVSIPQGNENAVYVVVNRTIQGATRRYIEQVANLELVDPVSDPIFVDSSLQYDGRNAGAGTITMTLSNGTTWAYDETLTLTASSAFFAAGMLTNKDQIVLHGSDGTILKFNIDTVYSSTTVVTGHTTATVPASMRGVAITTWDRAVSVVSGLDHLDGQSVSVYADGFVVASPNNANYPTPTVVTSGTITLDGPYAHIWAGLPYTGDIETLDLDLPNGESLKDTKVDITRIGVYVEASRGSFVGIALPAGNSTSGPDPVDATQTITLDEIKFRLDTDNLNAAPNALTQYMFANVGGTWNRTGRGVIRHVDPIPLTVLAIVPMGLIPL